MLIIRRALIYVPPARDHQCIIMSLLIITFIHGNRQDTKSVADTDTQPVVVEPHEHTSAQSRATISDGLADSMRIITSPEM